MTTESVRGAPSLLDYLAVLRRRKRLFVSMLVLVPVVAVTLSLQRNPVYQASAEVLLVNPTSVTAGGQAPYVDPNRVAQTKSELARVPAVAKKVLNSVPGHGLTVEKFLKNFVRYDDRCQRSSHVPGQELRSADGDGPRDGIRAGVRRL